MRDVKFGFQVSLGLAGRIVSMLVGFGGSIVLARTVGPEIFGQYFLFLSIASLLDNPITGWGQGVRKRLTEQTFPDEQAVGAAYSSFILIPLIAVVVNLVIQRTGFLMDTQNPAVLVPLMFVASASYTVVKELLNGTVYFGSVNWVDALRDILRVVFQLSLVVLGFSLSGMVVGFVGATLIAIPVTHHLVGISPKIPSVNSLRSIWRYARHAIPRRMLGTALTRMDILLLGFVTASATAGQYQAALNITLPATLLVNVAAPGLMSRVSSLNSDPNIESVATHVQRSINFSSIVAIPIVAGAAVFGSETVVLIYSPKYAEAGLFVFGIATFQLLKSQTSIYTSVIEGINRPDLTLRYSLIQFTINLGLGIVLLISIGPVGVIVATVFAKFLHYFLTMWKVTTKLNINPIDEPIQYQITAAVLMAIVVGVLGRNVTPEDSFLTIFVLLSGIITYCSILLFDGRHRNLALSLIRETRSEIN